MRGEMVGNFDMNVVIDFFTNRVHIKEIGLALCIYLILRFARKIVMNKIFKFMMKHAAKTKSDLDDKLFKNFEKPIDVFMVFLSGFIAVNYYIKATGGVGNSPILFSTMIKVTQSAFIYTTAWGFYNLSGERSALFDSFKNRLGIKVDKILYPFIVKCLRFLMVAIAAIIILDIWDINVSTLVAGFGLGGLAFSLAAKDFASNIIGGIALIMEKPFNIGDWIKADSIEGVVEDISFRSTRIRTFAQELIIVPNSMLANTSIKNFTKRGKRRISFKLGVTYRTTKAKLKECIDSIENMLRAHEQVHQETIFVKFEGFNNSSLDIFLYFFTKTTDWGEYLEIKQDINFKIIEIFEEHGIEFAFPSTSVYVEETGRKIESGVFDIKDVALDKERE